MRCNVFRISSSSFLLMGSILFFFLGVELCLLRLDAETRVDANLRNQQQPRTEHEAIVRRFHDVVFDVERIDERDKIVTSEYIDHNPLHLGSSLEARPTNADSFPFGMGFSDIQIAIEDTMVEVDQIVVRVRLSGRHTKTFMGIRPTEKQVDITGIEIYRISDGKISERWANFDSLMLMKQLGVIQNPFRILPISLSPQREQSTALTQSNSNNLIILQNWEALNTRYKRDSGRVRIIALLSPN